MDFVVAQVVGVTVEVIEASMAWATSVLIYDYFPELCQRVDLALQLLNGLVLVTQSLRQLLEL